MREISDAYKNPVGTWEVTTEADVEGRRAFTLGIFTGHFAEIAYELSSRACYSLTFKRLPEKLNVPKATKHQDSVAVCFNVESGTWDLSSDRLAAFARDLIKEIPDMSISEGGTYKGFTLNFHRETPDQKRAAALAKLTDEEIALLGIER